MKRGVIFNLQRYSVHDGPGIRTTVFFKGCPLDCAWCHNPEGRSGMAEVQLIKSRCLHCGACVTACPQGGPVNFPPGVPRLAEILGAAQADPECTFCGSCVDACPTDARELSGKALTAPELMTELLRDRVYYDESGGGVTLSGGEPLAQVDFVCELLAACRKQALHAAVDTCGAVPAEALFEASSLTDLFLYDIKHTDPDRHRALTGRGNEQILENLERLAERHDRIWIRVPVVPGQNDDEDNLRAVGAIAARLDAVEQVNLLPYHALDREKRQRLGFTETLGEIAAPSQARLDRLAGLVADRGAAVVIGG